MVKKKEKTSIKGIPIYAVEDPDSYGLNKEQVRKLWQSLVDTGMAWRLQGWYGRTATDLIEQGFITYPKKHKGQSSTDYYGNKIPTHKEYLEMKRRKK